MTKDDEIEKSLELCKDLQKYLNKNAIPKSLDSKFNPVAWDDISQILEEEKNMDESETKYLQEKKS